jgi:hypothetical protein
VIFTFLVFKIPLTLLHFLSGFEIQTENGKTKLVSVNEYLEYMRHERIWGDGIMLSAATLLFRRDVTVLSGTTNQTIHEYKCDHPPDPHYQNKSVCEIPKIFLRLVSYGAQNNGKLDHYVSLSVYNESLHDFDTASSAQVSLEAWAPAAWVKGGRVTPPGKS